MIASVVATIDDTDETRRDILDRIARIACVEVGLADTNALRIPITIDSTAPHALEEVTRRLQECRGVVFVDVVFVHFEDESLNIPVPLPSVLTSTSQTAHD